MEKIMRLVLFDMDHTLVPADTGTIWSQFLQERNLISLEKAQERAQFLADYQNGTLNVEEAYRFELGVLQSLEPDLRKELLNQFFKDKVKPLITAKALQQVAEHRKNGDYLIMITATLEEIASPIAEFFGMDHLIGGRGQIDALGNYTGEIELEPCMGRGKLVHLEEWLVKTGNNPVEYTFYSDSHNDLPLLEQVDVAIAVDPDAKLRQIAQDNNWQIISFLNS
jgi:HAD superfamily hydrolase (TIGR01490 family)